MRTAVGRDHDLVAAYFVDTAPFWKEVYGQETLSGELYRLRLELVNRYVSGLPLAGGARALDIGCGAGFNSMFLARRGFRVDAVDVAQLMIESLRGLADQAGLAHLVNAQIGDIHRLDFPDRTFDLVTVIGVLEWTPELHAPLAEIKRVLKPGGYAVVNVDNTWALHCVLDPGKTPFVRPLKRGMRAVAEALGVREKRARSARHSIRQLDAAARKARLEKISGLTCGFGPFTILGRNLFTECSALKLHERLQRLADSRTPILRSMGEVCLLLARRGESE